MFNLLNHARRADITFCRDGRIFIASRLSRMLSLCGGDSVNVAYDNGKLYLFVVRRTASAGRLVARCYPSKKGCRHFCACSASLCHSVLLFSKPDANRVCFIADEPIQHNYSTYIPLIPQCPYD